MKRVLLLCFLQTLLVFTVQGASAQPEGRIDELLSLDIESLMNVNVSVASKKSEKISEAPGIVNVMTAEEIAASGSQTLFEALERMPGVFGVFSTLFGETSVGIRGESPGTGNSHVLLLLNGRPVREGFSGALDMLMLGTFPLTLVERIEVISGPGSVLYGTNAFSGVINVITKKTENKAQGEAALTYGSFSTHQTEGRAGYGGDDFHIDAAFRSGATSGYKVEGNDLTGLPGSDRMKANNFTFAMNAGYGGFTLNAFSGYESIDQLPIPPFFPFTDSSRKQNLIDLGYKHALSENWAISLNGAFTHWNNRLTTLSHSKTDDWLGEVALSGALDERTNLLIGGTYQFIEGQEDVNGFSFINKRTGAYAQVDHKPTDWLKLIAGAQLNKPRGVPRDISPRLGAIVQFDENWGSKLLYGKAFRSANASEQFINLPGIIVGDPGLNPEKIETWDAQVFYQSMNYYGALSLFKSTQSDPIVVAGTNYVNGEEIYSHGGTLEGKASIADDWKLSGAITYQDNESSTTGTDAYIVPNWNAKAGLTWSGDGVTVDAFDNYFSSADAPGTTAPINPNPDSYHLLTTNIDIELHEFAPQIPQGINLSIYGFNLLDEDIPTNLTSGGAGSINNIQSRAGRSGYVTLSMKF